MPGGFAHQKLPANFDGVTFIDQDYAADLDGSLQISDGRIPGHPWFTLTCAVWPHSTDALTNRVFLRFNGDSGARYEYSHRAFLNTSDTPPSTEAPSIEHAKDQTEIYLLPNNAVFQLSAVDKVFVARIDVMQMDQKEDYRVFCTWSVGTSSPSVHPRWGTVVGNWSGVGTTGIGQVDVFLGTAGKMKAGSYLIGHGLQSSILGGGYVYKVAELPTGKLWIDGRPIYRYTITNITLPSPGNLTNYTLPVTDSDPVTSRFVELWAHKASISEARRLTDMRVKLSTTQATFDSPAGGFDFSTYTGVGVWEYCKV